MKKIMTVAALAGLCGAAQAQGYVGGSVGMTSSNVDCAGTVTCDNNGTGGKLFGGFRLDSGVGFEAFFVNFGEAKATVDSVFGRANVKLSSQSIGAAVSFEAPLAADWALGARLGVAQNKAKASVSGAAVGSNDETKTGAYFGLNVSWKVTKELSLDLAADFSKFELTGESYNVRMLGAGLTYRF